MLEVVRYDGERLPVWDERVANTLTLIAVQVYGDLRERRLAQGRHPHSPSP